LGGNIDRSQALIGGATAISGPSRFLASCCRNVACAVAIGNYAGQNDYTRRFIRAVCKKIGLSRNQSVTLVELLLKEITNCLECGETVKLSSFGLFVVREKGQRRGRNPKTGEEVPIPPRRVVVFKPSAILKQRINFTTRAVK
jgi:integration host factor subunit alpha